MSGKNKTLEQLASEIASLQADFVTGVRTNLERARAIGDKLVEVKQMIRYGKFEQWILDNCPFGRGTANDYMRIAYHWDEISSDPELYAASIHAAIQKIRGHEPHKSKETGYVPVRVSTDALDRLIDKLEDVIGDLVAEHGDLAPLMEDITRWRQILHKLKLVRRAA